MPLTVFDQFEGTLQLASASPCGSSAFGFYWVEPKSKLDGDIYFHNEFKVMLLGGFASLLRYFRSEIKEGCTVSGKWGYVKRGSSTGLIYLGPS